MDNKQNELKKAMITAYVAAVCEGIIEAACLKQISSDGGTFIANKNECSITVDELLESTVNINEVAQYREQLLLFKLMYGLQ